VMRAWWAILIDNSVLQKEGVCCGLCRGGMKEVDVWIGCKGMERRFFVFCFVFSGFVFLGGYSEKP